MSVDHCKEFIEEILKQEKVTPLIYVLGKNMDNLAEMLMTDVEVEHLLFLCKI